MLRPRIPTRGRLCLLISYFTILFGVIAVPAARAATTINVPADYPTIQEAVDAAISGDTVEVGPGTYEGGIEIIDKTITLTSTDGPAVTTIEGPSDQSGVRIGNGGGALLGFTITNAWKGVHVHDSASVLVEGNVIRENGNEGGIEVFKTIDVQIRNNTIQDNVGACNGYGIEVSRTDVTIEANAILDNRSKSCGSSSGGGIHVRGSDSAVVIRDNEIAGHRVTAGGSAIRVWTSESATIEENYIHDNVVTEGSGGAIQVTPEYGAIHSVARNLVMSNQSPGISAVLLGISRADVINNVIIDNHSDAPGSGVRLRVDHEDGEGYGRIINNTLFHNSGPASLASMWDDGSSKIINNVIVPAPGAVGVYCANDPGTGDGLSPTLRFNDIAAPPDLRYGGVDCPLDLTGSFGNISDDPLFVSAATHDLHPSFGSPLIDAGRLAGSPNDDYDSQARPSDGNGDGTALPDIGAYEFALPETYLTGRVTSDFDGRGWPETCIDVHDVARSVTATTRSNSVGVWLAEVPAGTYRVRFQDCEATAHTTQWYDGAATFGTASDVPVAEGEGVANVDALLALRLQCFGESPTILGTLWNDNIVGTAGPDVIATLAGDDVVTGLGDRDRICAGSGADVIDGGPGHDRLNGNKGNDRLIGGLGNDRLKGSPGVDIADYTKAGRGVVVDLASGTSSGWGSDTLSGLEVIRGSRHDDVITGDDRDNRLNGRGGDDSIYGGPGVDIIDGGSGDDVLGGGPGNDDVRGGDGEDAISFEGAAGPVTVKLDKRLVAGADGSDEIIDVQHIIGSAYNDTLRGDRRSNTIHGGAGADKLIGLDGHDTLHGGPGADELLGGHLDDLLLGGPGPDTLRGQTSNDLLLGGPGDDVIRGGDGEDAVSYELSTSAVTVSLLTGTATGEGTDSIHTTEFAIGSPFDDILLGNAMDNILVGFGGSDLIEGRNGNDVLDGMAGTDTLNGGAGSDACLNGESHISCEVIEDTGAAIAWLEQRLADAMTIALKASITGGR